MFSKSRINETAGRAEAARASESAASAPVSAPVSRPSLDLGGNSMGAGSAPKPKPAASVLSADLQISGNIRTSGDVVIEGVVDGDIRAHLLTVGESATIRGEIIADDIVINGRVIGRVRGLKVRLTSTAKVEGDIIHKTIAIESGAHFEGSVQRQDDPLAASGQSASAAATASSAPRPAAAAPQPAAAPAPAARPSMPAEASRPAAPKAPMDSKASQ